MLFLLILAASIVIVSLLGHGIHWAIHRRWMGPAYRGHMEHHVKLYPPTSLVSDSYREARWYHQGPVLYTPPFIVLMLLVWAGTSLANGPWWVSVTFGVTMLVQGFINNWAHDSFHIKDHWLRRFGAWRRLCVLHYVHHRNMRSNYGIVLPAWDHAFGTFREGPVGRRQ